MFNAKLRVVNIFIGNLKTVLAGIHRAFKFSECGYRYLYEVQFVFKRAAQQLALRARQACRARQSPRYGVLSAGSGLLTFIANQESPLLVTVEMQRIRIAFDYKVVRHLVTCQGVESPLTNKFEEGTHGTSTWIRSP